MAGLKLTSEEREILINALVENEAIEEADREAFEDLKDSKLVSFADAVLNADDSDDDEDDEDYEDLIDDISDELEDEEDEEGDEDEEDEEEEDEVEEEEMELATNKKKVPPEFLKHMKKKGKKGCAEPTGNAHTCNKCGGNNSNSNQEEVMATNMTSEEWLESAPPEIAYVVNSAIKFANDEKAKIIEKLTANLSGTKKTEMVRKLALNSLDQLKDTLSLIPEAPAHTINTPVAGLTRSRNYAGAATTNNASSKKEASEPLVMPTLNWSEVSKEFAGQN